MPQTGRVVLEIYDLAGRRVRTLASGSVEPGEYEVRWDGRDDSGAMLASGVYLCQLRVGSFIESERVTLLK